jgi:hypothetical protein
VQVFGRRNDETLNALRGPAAEKRQGTKSRVGNGGGAQPLIGRLSRRRAGLVRNLNVGPDAIRVPPSTVPPGELFPGATQRA